MGRGFEADASTQRVRSHEKIYYFSRINRVTRGNYQRPSPFIHSSKSVRPSRKARLVIEGDIGTIH